MATKSLNFDMFTMPALRTESVSELLKAKEYVQSIFELSLADAPELVDLEAVYQKLLKAIEEPSLFSQFSRREEKLIPWALVQRIGEEPLFEQERAISITFSWFLDSDRFQAVPGLIQVFLSEYPVNSRKFSELKGAISELIIKADTPKLNKLREWAQSVSLFSPNVMQRFTKIAVNESIVDCISTYRLHRGLNFGNFFKVGLQSVLTELGASLSEMSSSRQLFIVDEMINTFIDSEKQFIYPSLRNDFAEGMLLSYQITPPKKRSKEKLKKLFLAHYGDPRISKSGWIGVSEEAVDVMRGWMVENTMNDFFNLLSHVAKTDSTADHHWVYRKRFWNAYLKKGVIQEAWVALGPQAKVQARNFLNHGSAFATLSGGAPNHSSLIMVIGGVLVTEWSHSGKYRVWDRDLSRPKLYKGAYRRSELISNCDYEGAHHSSDSGGWQYKLSTLINDLTGVSVSSREYMNDR
ncbi:hypothetical protein CA267_016095 [Alteromonas pelagimontana]|uniref:Zorya protein ZorC EH domain-containing protein n=1 Tax=Alteromonas pelagimontana TaxID=1858656 RepID=A0A6M4MGG2_9ALTE|nr:EH signature domain-containing protein [Alteromonas pelagimontana]QJR82163.1 hypothetical protein CA267_016095 [Alteromonas pelagimontana]